MVIVLPGMVDVEGLLAGASGVMKTVCVTTGVVWMVTVLLPCMVDVYIVGLVDSSLLVRHTAERLSDGKPKIVSIARRCIL